MKSDNIMDIDPVVKTTWKKFFSDVMNHSLTPWLIYLWAAITVITFGLLMLWQ